MNAQDLNRLFTQAPIAVCILSGRDYKVELVNEKMLEFLGRDQDIIGQPLENSLTEAKQQGLLAVLDKVSETKKPIEIKNFTGIILIDGIRETRHFDVVFKPYFLEKDDTEISAIFCVAHNITEQVKALEKLEEEKKRTMLALETGGLGMISSNWQKGVIHADRRAREIFHVKDSEDESAWHARIYSDDREVRRIALQQAVDSGSYDLEFRITLEDGTIRWIRSRGTLQHDAAGEPLGSFGVVQDVTALKEFAQALQNKVQERTTELEMANETLRKLNSDLERSNHNLEEFTRASSHDLKEPIRKVHVFIDRLRGLLDSRLTPAEIQLFERVDIAAQRMRTLVDDLLEFSHLDEEPKEMEMVDLNKKIRLIQSDLELIISEKQATIDVGEMPVVKGHRRQIQQLFQNLIVNGIKYSKPNVKPEIVIRAKVIKGMDSGQEMTEQQKNHSYHKIEVCDNGIGFNQEDAERIFNAFTRLHAQRDYPGSGIGLSIVKKVVANHDGFIYAKSEKGKGSCFTVLLPA